MTSSVVSFNKVYVRVTYCLHYAVSIVCVTCVVCVVCVILSG